MNLLHAVAKGMEWATFYTRWDRDLQDVLNEASDLGWSIAHVQKDDDSDGEERWLVIGFKLKAKDRGVKDRG